MEQNDSQRDRFQYSQLKGSEPCIRLLKLFVDETHPGELSCSNYTFTLAQIALYKALSYTWGNPFPPDQVLNSLGELFPPDEEFQGRLLDWEAQNNSIRCNGSIMSIGLDFLRFFVTSQSSRSKSFSG